VNRYLTAFGASRVAPIDPLYTDVRLLSAKIGAAGWSGITGGHQGMMAAFAEGIADGGGKVRGITLERFPTPPGNALTEEIRAADFFARMQMLIEQADAYIVLPGGLGTLAELAMSWDLLAIRVLEPRPLILYGAMWGEVLDSLRTNLLMSVEHGFSILHHCTTHDEVLATLADCTHGAL